jgi:pyoverdine/dityrosine biosynthesis protein Dit1
MLFLTAQRVKKSREGSVGSLESKSSDKSEASADSNDSVTATSNFVVTLSLDSAKQKQLAQHPVVRLVNRFNRYVAVDTLLANYQRTLRDLRRQLEKEPLLADRQPAIWRLAKLSEAQS